MTPYPNLPTPLLMTGNDPLQEIREATKKQLDERLAEQQKIDAEIKALKKVLKALDNPQG